MKKISCINFSKNEMYELSVAYSLSAMKRAGSCVEYYRISPNNLIEKVNEVIASNPEMVVFHVSYHSYDILMECCKKLKIGLSNVIILACNNIASCIAEDLLRDIKEIDFIVVGEFENTLEEIARSCITRDDIKKIDGLSYYESGQYRQNPLRQDAEIDTIEFPDRDYDDNNSRNFLILASRGCEGTCSFCDKNYLYKVNGNNFHRLRSIASIVDEIDLLVEKYNCKFVSFIDSSFGMSNDLVKRLDDFYSTLKEKNYWVQFLFCLRCEQIDQDVINALLKLKEVGLSKVYVGIESFIKDDLDLYKKRSNEITNINAIELMKQLNDDMEDYVLEVGYGFILFNPYTTLEQLRSNYRELCRNHLFINPYILTTRMSVSVLGTVYKKLEEDGLLKGKVCDYPLQDRMQRRLQYSFKEDEIQKIYDLTIECTNIIKYRNFNGIEAFRNRYYHYIGMDSKLRDFDKTYNEWKEVVDSNTRQLFEYIIDGTDEWEIKKKNALLKSVEVKKQIDKSHENVNSLRYVLAKKLSKMDELVFR